MDRDNLILLPGLQVVEDAEGTGAEITEADAEIVEVDPGFRAPTPAELPWALEAVLFASSQPISFDALRTALGEVDASQLRASLTALEDSLVRRGAGVRLHEIGGGYQLRTVPRAATWVAKARGATPLKLSRAAVETLSIVAYRQPVTRHEVERIRGVDCGGMLRTLLGRKLLKVLGRQDMPGRPLVYGTTSDFLAFFGLRDLSDLPTLRDLRELQAQDPTLQSEAPI